MISYLFSNFEHFCMIFCFKKKLLSVEHSEEEVTLVGKCHHLVAFIPLEEELHKLLPVPTSGEFPTPSRKCF